MMRIKNCLRFIPRSPWAWAVSRRARGGSDSAALRECESESDERDQQRHEPYVHDLGPELKPFALDAQVLAHVLQLKADLGGLLAKVVDLDLLFGRQYRARSRARFAFLKLLQLLLRLVQAVLELLDFSEILLLRARLHLLDHRKRTCKRRAAAQAHEVLIARELLDETLRKREIAIARDDQFLSEH